MDPTRNEVILPELYDSEQRIIKIKSELDKFEDVFMRVKSGYGTGKYLNEEYHNLIISTRDLSVHLANVQKTLESGAQDPSLRARAHSLNNQAISQLRRLQNLGTEVQRFVRQERVQPGPPDYGAEKHPPPFVDFASDGRPTQVQIQDEANATLQSQLEEQKAQEMEQLESDIIQVNELFTTLATYVHEQGTLVDSIGDNIEVAYEKVEAGTHQLDSAVSHRKSVRRRKCICIIITVVILILIALAIGLSVR